MSKKAKTKAQDRRRKEKRARKEAMQKLYASWARDGRNRKSARNVRKSKTFCRSARNFDHPNGPCGNLGCLKCFPQINLPENSLPGTILYKRRFM